MNNPVGRLAGVLGTLFTTLFAASCSEGAGGGTGPDPDDAIASVVVSPSQATVAVGSAVQLSVTVLNGRGESLHQAAAWTSSSVPVASVDDNGLVSGLSAGVATVTASVGGISGSSAVTVTDPAERSNSVLAHSGDPTSTPPPLQT